MENKHLLLCLAMLIQIFEVCSGQININSSGAHIKSEKGSVTFTIGQVVNAAIDESNTSLNIGIQQPYEIFISTGIEQYFIDLSIRPNPAMDYLLLTVRDYPLNGLVYLLYNSGGHLLEKKSLKGTETFIELLVYPSSIYILKIMEENRTLKTFKIVKY